MRGSYVEGDGSLSEILEALCVLENVRIDFEGSCWCKSASKRPSENRFHKDLPRIAHNVLIDWRDSVPRWGVQTIISYSHWTHVWSPCTLSFTNSRGFI